MDDEIKPRRPARRTPKTVQGRDGRPVSGANLSGKSRRLVISIYPDDLYRLDALCRNFELSRSAVIAMLIKKAT